MPVMDGYEATRRIKADAQQKQAQSPVIIALTASAFEENRAEIIAAGCDDFVRKPIQADLIFEKIAQYLEITYRYSDDALSSESSLTTPNIAAPNIATLRTDALRTDAIALKTEHWVEHWAKHCAEDLTVMSPEWIKQLNQAAIQVDADAIFKLLEQIPDTHSSLARALSDLTQGFYFDEIIQLTQLKV